MLYNLLFNSVTNETVTLDSDEGLSDLAFAQGWRILVHAKKIKQIYREIFHEAKAGQAPLMTPVHMAGWQFNEMTYLLADDGDIPLYCDDLRFTPYIDDVADTDEPDYFMDETEETEEYTESEEI